ncbi:hypothetical protein [Halomonas sp. 707D7]|uniref:hypothetical protein n=1 Tax=Halomonas sp. 707D7 TaxID=1681044 RepID=UPI00209F9CE4|nr:hypothetical protein [Halomonas sp. 707D7]MCP1315126.1 hypothetical protein [Halomonas sp. 707D7]
MDKQDKPTFKRKHLIALGMLATVTSLTLAGCGNDDEDELPPAQQPETMEQSGAMDEPALNDDPAMTEPAPADPAMSDPGLEDDAATSQEPMPGGEPGMTTAEDPEENPGFGDGTEPMPGSEPGDADDDDTTTTN